MGCVFSEAAVWSRFGWTRLLEYRRQRAQEIQERRDLTGEEWFHDEHNVLRTVRETHEHIARRPQSIHQVIVNILQLVDNTMLLNEHEQRASARGALTEFTRMIDMMRETIGIGITRGSSWDGQEAEDGNGFEDRPITPPSVPPGYMSTSGEPSHKNTSRDIGTPLFPRPLSFNRTKRNTSKLQIHLAHRQHQAKAMNRNYQAQLTDDPFGPFLSDSNSLHDLPDPPSPASSYHSSETDNGSLAQIHAKGTHPGMGGEPLDGEPTSTEGDTSLPGRQVAEDATTAHRRFSNRRTRGYSNDALAGLEGSEVPMHLATVSPNSNGTMSSRSTDNPTSSKYEAQKHEEKPPQLPLSEGLLWKDKKKKGLHDPLHGQENLASLNTRDHVGASSQKLDSIWRLLMYLTSRSS